MKVKIPLARNINDGNEKSHEYYLNERINWVNRSSNFVEGLDLPFNQLFMFVCA
jgi:hypothetical protein